MNSNIWALIVALFLAFSDVFNLGLLKMVRTGQISNHAWIGLPTVLYACQPLIFFFGLSHTSMTVLNLLWDLLSDILVTASGIFYFKEKISMKKYIGIAFGLLSIMFLAGDDE